MPSDQILVNAKILVVDDDQMNVILVERVLDWAGCKNVRTVRYGAEALFQFEAFQPDLILLDLHMPGIDGYEVLRAIREKAGDAVFLPIIVFTADATSQARERALELGATDFLTKPGDATEIKLRMKNFLHLRMLDRKLNEKAMELEQKVRDRTRELEDAQVEILERLARAAEYRDEDTSEHTRRVGDLSAEIALALGEDPKFVELIRLAARLHDVGKIGISDQILRKPGKLTPEEFAQMKEHATIGAMVLSNGRSPLLQMAERIAHSHHERFDGTGYPRGLAGNQIPLEGRIVAVADVFDALTSDRPYKRAWTEAEAIETIQAECGTHFDPRVVLAFLSLMPVLAKAA